MSPEVCPNCGADVPRNAKACPECGSCEETGWSDDAHTPHPDLPEDEEFNYDEYVKKEFGTTPKPSGVHWLWWIVAILLILAIIKLSLF